MSQIIPELETFIAGKILRQPGRAIAADEAIISSGLVDSFSLMDLALFVEDTFGVRKDHARRGIGRELLRDFMRHAEVLGAQSVRTLLNPEDDRLNVRLGLQIHKFIWEPAMKGV